MEETGRPAHRQQRPHRTDAAAEGRQRLDRAAAKDVANHSYQLLQSGDPVLRAQFLARILDRMDRDYHAEIIAAVERLAADSGRDLRTEIAEPHLRAGQVDGTNAMARWKESGFSGSRAAATFQGWALADPARAKEWLDDQADLGPPARTELLRSLLAGAAACDPAEAGKIFSSLALDDRIEGAKSVVAELEKLSAAMPVEEHLLSRVMGQILNRSVTGGIAFLDEIVRSQVLGFDTFNDSTWHNAVGFALDRDPGSVASRLETNPDSPIHTRVAEIYHSTITRE